MHVAFDQTDPFNLPRFRHPGELAQFLIDEAVQRYANQFSLQERTFVPNSGGGSVAATDNFQLNRLVAKGAALSVGYSTTNVQHAGIDEADVVETDGDFIYALTDGRLVIVDVRDVTNPLLVSVTQFDSSFTEMYLQGDRLTLISRGSYYAGAKVAVLDVSDRGEPQLLERTEIDGQIVDTRAIGDRVFVVTQQGLDYPAPIRRVVSETPAEDGSGVWQVCAYETLDEYLERVNETLPDLLPQFKTFNGSGELIRSGPLSDVNQIHKPLSKADGVLMSVITFDVADEMTGPVTSSGLFTSSADQIYVSSSAVYVLRQASRWSDGSDGTRILKFQFQEDGRTSLEAAGRVTGSILNQFSLDEHEGRLRVVTTETAYDYLRRVTHRQNHLFVLEQVGTELTIVGSLERLAPTEEVKSVRFVGDRAYVVTFRQVDPLFMLDLRTPTSPQIAGAIKIPGYSSYLHPVGDHFILGIGRDVDETNGQEGPVQISLFDVRELGEPVLVDRMTLSGVDWFTSEALFDHHAIAYFADEQVLSIPISWQHTVSEDIDGDGTPDTSHTEMGSSAFVFQLVLDGADVGVDFTGRIDHDSTVRRSVRIGDALVTISSDCVKVHQLTDPGVLIAEVYVGDLLRFDQFDIVEDSGPTELDVLANDRPGNGGEPLGIVSVTQPISYNWLGNGVDPQAVGTVTIAADGRSLVFTPAANFFGTAVFSYTVFDEIRGEQTTNVTVRVDDVPDLPDAVNDEFEVAPGSTSVPLYVLANDVNFDQGRSIVGWNGDYSYYISGGIRLAQVVATNDLSTTIAATDSISLVRSNVLFPHQLQAWGSGYNGLKITTASFGDHGGTIEVDISGQLLQYTPAAGFEGIETFTYTIESEQGLTDTATVTVRVGAVSDLVLATSFAGPATERETAPTELASPGRPSQVVAPPAVAFASGAVARSGAVISARQEFFAPSQARSQFSSYRSLDSINLSHLASFRARSDSVAHRPGVCRAGCVGQERQAGRLRLGRPRGAAGRSGRILGVAPFPRFFLLRFGRSALWAARRNFGRRRAFNSLVGRARLTAVGLRLRHRRRPGEGAAWCIFRNEVGVMSGHWIHSLAIRKLTLVVGVLVVWATVEPACAQRGRGFRRLFGVSRALLASHPDVQAELKMTGEQKTRVTEINNQLHDERHEVLGTAFEGWSSVQPRLEELQSQSVSESQRGTRPRAAQKTAADLYPVERSPALQDPRCGCRTGTVRPAADQTCRSRRREYQGFRGCVRK